ncbi:MAG: hypothetical protein FWD63_01610 [Propionibacteriaceae bacterium]|nr:hypothetical protein [Propionibacteriaceae bacterium]
MPNTAQLEITSSVQCAPTAGGAQTGRWSIIGERWYPTQAQKVGTNWWLKGSSGWWPATVNKSVENGQPVVIAVPDLAGGQYHGPGYPGTGPAILVRLPYFYDVCPGQIGYVSVFNYPGQTAKLS